MPNNPTFNHEKARQTAIALALWLTCLCYWPPLLLAQEVGNSGATLPESRAAEIEAARQRKASTTQPEINSRLEQRLIWIKESRVLERFIGGIGGWRLKLGGLAAGGGFAIGPEYARDDL